MLLALDHGASTGVAWGTPGSVPKFATWVAPWSRKTASVDLGQALSWFEDELQAFIRETKVSHIVFEAPWMPRGQRADMETLKLVTCLCGLVEKAAFERGVTVEEIAGATWKLAVMGKGGPQHKRPIQQNLRMRGLSPRDFHQADAGGVWLAAQFLREPALREVYRPVATAIGGRA